MNVRKEVKTTLDEEFQSVIWKIEIDSANNLIAVETRSAESHTATLSAYNYLTGVCYFKELSIEAGWHWHLDRVYSEFVLLYGYTAPSSPEHKGIIAIDINSGKVCWQIFHLTLTEVSNKGIIAYNPLLQSKKPILLDIKNGNQITDFNGEFTPVVRDVSFPEMMTTSMEKAAFLPANIAGIVAYAKVNSKECYSFHILENGSYIQYLIITGNGEVLKKEILASGIQKLNPEAFFTSGHAVFAVKGNNRRVLACLL